MNIGYKATMIGLFAFVLVGGFNVASGTYHMIGLKKKIEVMGVRKRGEPLGKKAPRKWEEDLTANINCIMVG